jgi:hypothetical protein
MHRSHLRSLRTLFTIALVFLGTQTFCETNPSQATDGQDKSEPGSPPQAVSESPEKGFWETLKGSRARDALLLGMWSIHLDGTGEYFGDGRNNDQGHMLGAQCYGITAGTFINSHDDRAYFAGLAREVFSYPYPRDFRIDLGYKLGLLYSYGDDLPNLYDFSVFAAATASFSWKRIGIDVGLIPVGIMTLNFRVDLH